MAPINSRLQQPLQQTFTTTSGKASVGRGKGEVTDKGDEATVGNGPSRISANPHSIDQKGLAALRRIIDRGNWIKFNGVTLMPVWSSDTGATFVDGDGNYHIFSTT